MECQPRLRISEPCKNEADNHQFTVSFFSKTFTSRRFYTNVPRVHCFDELDVEQTVNYWGNNCNVMGEILLSRYDLFISNKMITHVTTNLNSQELEEIYGIG